MKIVVNAQQIDTDAKTLYELILELKVENKIMAAAINMEVVKKTKWQEALLKEGDKVELLNFVGGG